MMPRTFLCGSRQVLAKVCVFRHYLLCSTTSWAVKKSVVLVITPLIALMVGVWRAKDVNAVVLSCHLQAEKAE